MNAGRPGGWADTPRQQSWWSEECFADRPSGATMTSSKRQVAIKVPPTPRSLTSALTRLKSLLREASSGRRIAPPGIGPGPGHQSPPATKTCSSCSNGSAGRPLPESSGQKQAPPRRLAEIKCAVCEAIFNAYKAGLVHRDLEAVEHLDRQPR